MLYTVKLENSKLHISKGNSKIGKTIWSFSTLPGNKQHLLYVGNQTLLTDIPGTCGSLCSGCFKDCYAVNSVKLHHNSVCVPWAENTLLLRSGRLWNLLETFLDDKNKKATANIKKLTDAGISQEEAIKQSKSLAKITLFRINVSGEVQTANEFAQWGHLAIKHPEIQFGVYTKNFDALGEYLHNVGNTPNNFVINISQWNHCADTFLKEHPYNLLNVFEYDPTNLKSCDWSQADKDRLAALHHCPAVDKKGHHANLPNGDPITCDKCRRCYTKTGNTTAVYAH